MLALGGKNTGARQERKNILLMNQTIQIAGNPAEAVDIGGDKSSSSVASRKPYIPGKVKVLYTLNEDGRKKSLLAGGNGKAYQEILLCVDIDEEILSFCEVADNGDVILDLARPRIIGLRAARPPSFDEPIEIFEQAIDAARSFQERINLRKNAAVVEISQEEQKDVSRRDDRAIKDEERIRDNNLIYIKSRKQQLENEFGTFLWRIISLFEGSDRAEFDKIVDNFLMEVEERRKNALKSRREAEKREWILVHGSSHLQQVYLTGDSCDDLYVCERAASLLGDGWHVDIGNTASFVEIRQPTREAVALCKRISTKGFKVRIVRLESLGEGKAGDYGPYPAEAVVVDSYLGLYNLYYITWRESPFTT